MNIRSCITIKDMMISGRTVLLGKPLAFISAQSISASTTKLKTGIKVKKTSLLKIKNEYLTEHK